MADIELLLLLLFLNRILLFYYKLNIHSLVNLLQPCHLTLALQSIALTSNGPAAVLLAIMLMPMYTNIIFPLSPPPSPTFRKSINTFLKMNIIIFRTFGSLLAITFPALEGLSQPYELEAFWILHTLIQIVPFYLLVRNNFAALKVIQIAIFLLLVVNLLLF